MKSKYNLLTIKLSIVQFRTFIYFNWVIIILNSLILILHFIYTPNPYYSLNFTYFECHQNSKILTLCLSTNHNLTRYTNLTIYTSLCLNLINIYVNEMQKWMQMYQKLEIRVRMWHKPWDWKINLEDLLITNSHHWILCRFHAIVILTLDVYT